VFECRINKNALLQTFFVDFAHWDKMHLNFKANTSEIVSKSFFHFKLDNIISFICNFIFSIRWLILINNLLKGNIINVNIYKIINLYFLKFIRKRNYLLRSYQGVISSFGKAQG